MHEGIESRRALEQVVNTTEHAEDTEREDPDTDDRNDGSVTTDEEAEKTEEGSEDINDQDGSGQLPRGNGVPEGTIGTGDENEPIL